jgi:hypothetical protein
MSDDEASYRYSDDGGSDVDYAYGSEEDDQVSMADDAYGWIIAETAIPSWEGCPARHRYLPCL